MKNKVLCGDSGYLLTQFRECADLVVTSPPYDSLRTYGGHVFDFPVIAHSLFWSIKRGGVLVWVVGDSVEKGSETGSSFRQALYFQSLGFLLHDTMIFEKNTSSFPAKRGSNRYSQIFEYMFVFSRGKPKTVNLICDKKNKWAGWTNWGRQTKRNKNGVLVTVPDLKPVPKHSPRNNIWKFTVSGGFGHKDKRAYEHPATFPLALAEDHIKTWSNPGDLVVDPMCGSGTTLVAALSLKRNFLGIDIEKKYVELSRKRLKKI